MEVKVQVVIDVYKDEIARLSNEIVLLKAQIRQLQNELIPEEVILEEGGEE